MNTARKELEAELRELDPTLAHTPRRCDLLNRLAWDLRADDPRRARALAATAQAVAGAIGHTRGRAESLRNLGIAAYYLSSFEEALELTLKALELFVEDGDKLGESTCLSTLGLTYRQLGDYASALDHQLRCLAIREELGDPSGLVAPLNSIGLLHFVLGDHEAAGHCYERSLEVSREVGDESGVAHALNNLGGLYEARGEHRRAIEQYEASLEMSRALGDGRQAAVALNNLGESLLHAGDPARAREALEESLRLKEEMGNRVGQIDTLVLLASVHETLGSAEEAEMRLARALTLAEDLKARPDAARVHQSLAELNRRRGRLEDALLHHERFRVLERQMLGEESEARTRHLRIGFQVEQARREASLYRSRTAELWAINEAQSQALAESEAARKKLEEADAMKNELLGIVVHDLKNPLQSIIGLSELLAADLADAPQAEMSLTVLMAARRMLHSIESFLKMAAMDSGRLELDRRNVDLGELVAACAEANRAQARRKEQTILVEAETGLVAVGDLERLREVMDNLVSNAIKYSPAGAAIQIRLRRNAEAGRIEVQDQGPGLTDDDRARLFGRFQKLSARPTGGESSTGLGLAIVKQLVELHHGRVWAESDGPGTGALFVLQIPLVAQSATK